MKRERALTPDHFSDPLSQNKRTQTKKIKKVITMSFRRLKLSVGSIASVLVSVSVAQADLKVNFYEGAPKDRFRIENTGACAIPKSVVLIDLSRSQGGLIFDVTATGQGVEVYQPFEIVQGADTLARMPTVLDGQTKIELEIESLKPDETVEFTIDVDDTLGQRAITVSGSEIYGTVASYIVGAAAVSAVFSSGPEAVIEIPNC